MIKLDKYKSLLERLNRQEKEGEPLPPFADHIRERTRDVVMNDAKMLEVGTDGETQTIGTSSLAGCLAIVAVVEDPSGKRRCGLAHYDPMSLRIEYTKEQARLRELERKKAEDKISVDEEAELSGLRIFPKNPRAAELRRKEALKTMTDEEEEELRQIEIEKNSQTISNRPRSLERKKAEGTISDEEEAELLGLRLFPNNPRAAELRKKEVLRTMTDEEEEELRQIYLQPKKDTVGISPMYENNSHPDPTLSTKRSELESIAKLFSKTSATDAKKPEKSSVIIMTTKTDDPFIEVIRNIAITKLGCSDVRIIPYGNQPSDRLDVTVPNHNNGSPSFSTTTESGSLNW